MGKKRGITFVVASIRSFLSSSPSFSRVSFSGRGFVRATTALPLHASSGHVVFLISIASLYKNVQVSFYDQDFFGDMFGLISLCSFLIN